MGESASGVDADPSATLVRVGIINSFIKICKANTATEPENMLHSKNRRFVTGLLTAFS